MMAAGLAATETTRRRLFADAAHELRTPLATLDAYLEGLADGIRAPGQDTWDIMAAQTARLFAGTLCEARPSPIRKVSGNRLKPDLLSS
jgi:signal transduction histidine kinase